MASLGEHNCSCCHQQPLPPARQVLARIHSDKCTRKAHFYNQLRLCDGQEGGTHTYKKKLRILLARKKSFVKIQETKKNNLKKKKSRPSEMFYPLPVIEASKKEKKELKSCCCCRQKT